MNSNPTNQCRSIHAGTYIAYCNQPRIHHMSRMFSWPPYSQSVRCPGVRFKFNMRLPITWMGPGHTFIQIDIILNYSFHVGLPGMCLYNRFNTHTHTHFYNDMFLVVQKSTWGWILDLYGYICCGVHLCNNILNFNGTPKSPIIWQIDCKAVSFHEALPWEWYMSGMFLRSAATRLCMACTTSKYSVIRLYMPAISWYYFSVSFHKNVYAWYDFRMLHNS